RGPVQPRIVAALLPPIRASVGTRMATAVPRRTDTRRFSLGDFLRRLDADVVARYVRFGDRPRTSGQAGVDVRGRVVHRVRHTPRKWLHERSWHLRLVEFRGPERGRDPQLHGGRNFHDPTALPRRLSLSGDHARAVSR